MIQNYENLLVSLYSKYNVQRLEAISYHHEGLRLFSKQMKEIKSQNLTGSSFLQAMEQADKEWDNLMQNYVFNEKAHELESRNVEFLAGCYADSFYDDGKKFIQNLLQERSQNNNLDFFIVSNSHSKHIFGLFNGAGFKNFNTEKLLGWDKTESLKNKEYYYSKLQTFSTSNINIIIGNSENEMILGKKAGFKTVFVEREIKMPINFENYIDLKITNLTNLSNLLKEKIL